jgi:hypothetical protein
MPRLMTKTVRALSTSRTNTVGSLTNYLNVNGTIVSERSHPLLPP